MTEKKKNEDFDFNLGDELIKSAKEAVVMHRGRMAKKHTIENTEVTPIKEFSPAEIKALQNKFQVSTRIFGQIMGASLKTIQSWEAGTTKPNKYAYRLMNIFAENPELAKSLIKKA